MTSQTNKPQALFPDLPRNRRIVKADGNIDENWYLYFDTLTTALQTYFKPEGIVIPQETPANIALLTAVASIANILYDSTNHTFKGNINGTWKTFTLT
jgi:hypothetical protein